MKTLFLIICAGVLILPNLASTNSNGVSFTSKLKVKTYDSKQKMISDKLKSVLANAASLPKTPDIFEKLSPSTLGLLCIIGGSLAHLAFGSLYCWWVHYHSFKIEISYSDILYLGETFCHIAHKVLSFLMVNHIQAPNQMLYSLYP